MEPGPPELLSPGDVDEGLLVTGGTSIITVAGPELAVGEMVVVEGSPLPSSPVTVRVTKEAGVEDEPGPAGELEGGTSTITVPVPVEPDGEIVDVTGLSVGLRVLPVVVIVVNGIEAGELEGGTSTMTVPVPVDPDGEIVEVTGPSVGLRLLPVVVTVIKGTEDEGAAVELGTITMTVPGSEGLLGGTVLVRGSSVGERLPVVVTVT